MSLCLRSTLGQLVSGSLLCHHLRLHHHELPWRLSRSNSGAGQRDICRGNPARFQHRHRVTAATHAHSPHRPSADEIDTEKILHAPRKTQPNHSASCGRHKARAHGTRWANFRFFSGQAVAILGVVSRNDEDLWDRRKFLENYLAYSRGTSIGSSHRDRRSFGSGAWTPASQIQ